MDGGCPCESRWVLLSLLILAMLFMISVRINPLCQCTRRGGAHRLPDKLPFDLYVSL